MPYHIILSVYVMVMTYHGLAFMYKLLSSLLSKSL